MEINEDANLFEGIPYLLQPLTDEEQGMLNEYDDHMKEHHFKRGITVKAMIYVAANIASQALEMWTQDWKDRNPEEINPENELQLRISQLGQLLTLFTIHPSIIQCRYLIVQLVINLLDMFYSQYDCIHLEPPSDNEEESNDEQT